MPQPKENWGDAEYVKMWLEDLSSEDDRLSCDLRDKVCREIAAAFRRGQREAAEVVIKNVEHVAKAESFARGQSWSEGFTDARNLCLKNAQEAAKRYD